MATGYDLKPVEIGIFAPDLRPVAGLAAGEVGYVATGLKTVRECRVGDTITHAARPAPEPLPGYRKVKPMVFAGIYPVEGEDYADLREALEKLQLNDASLIFEPETSQALDFGFRCGFLGMFHMEIIQERLEREYDLDIIVTAPSVEYEVVLHTGETMTIDSPADLPDEMLIARGARAVDEDRDLHPDRVLRPDHGADQEAARRVQVAGVPGAEPGAAQLRDPALRADRGLLRPAQIADQGLCLAGLPVCRIPPG